MAHDRVWLPGKVAIITGGGSGFGRGMVEKFVKEGAKVVLVDLDATASKVADSLHNVKFIQGDVSVTAEWERFLKLAIDSFGKLDVVCNVAGIIRTGPSNEISETDYDLLFRVNVKQLYTSTKVVIPYFKEHGGGVFINMASTGSPRPRPMGVWYCGTKAAVMNITKGLAVEWAPHNIRVNSIAPTAAATGMLPNILGGRQDSEQARKAVAESIPLGRWCDVKDVANLACFLASDDASFITGKDVFRLLTGDMIECDGGRSI